MDKDLQSVREALEYSIGYIKSALYTEQTNPNHGYKPAKSTIRHHNLAVDAITTLDNYIALQESEEKSSIGIVKELHAPFLADLLKYVPDDMIIQDREKVARGFIETVCKKAIALVKGDM